MRPYSLIAAAGVALALGACRDRGQADRNATAESSLSAENIVSNDVTAIDAVTADAANMAADVDYTDALANLSNNSSASEHKAGSTFKGKAADTATNAE